MGLLKYWEYTQVAVVASTDNYGSPGLAALTLRINDEVCASRACGCVVLASVSDWGLLGSYAVRVADAGGDLRCWRPPPFSELLVRAFWSWKVTLWG